MIANSISHCQPLKNTQSIAEPSPTIASCSTGSAAHIEHASGTSRIVAVKPREHQVSIEGGLDFHYSGFLHLIDAVELIDDVEVLIINRLGRLRLT